MTPRLTITALLVAAVAPAMAQEMKPPKEVTDLAWMVGTWTDANLGLL